MTMRRLDPEALDFGDVLRDAIGDGGIDAVGLIAHQRFARQFQQDAAVGGLARARAADTTGNYTGWARLVAIASTKCPFRYPLPGDMVG